MEAIAEASDLAADGRQRHLGRSMPVDGWPSSTLSLVVPCMASIPDHSARSRDVYLSAATSFTVGRSRKIYCAAPGSGWPERLRSHPKSLGTRQGPYLRTPKPGFAVASAKLASWFTAVAACHRAMQGIAGCGAEVAETGKA